MKKDITNDYLTIRLFILRQSIKAWSIFLKDYFSGTVIRIGCSGTIVGTFTAITYMLRNFTELTVGIIIGALVWIIACTVIFAGVSILVSFLYSIIFPNKILSFVGDTYQEGEVKLIKNI